MVPPTAVAKGSAVSVKDPAKETILTPRFYTTDFEAMAAMDLQPNEAELEAICEEFRKDYNRHHFVRNDEFDGAADKLDPQTRRVFIEFLEQSCTSEFSGFLLYKELSRRIKKKNPLLAECFGHMARDEARHAGFLNKAMSDFGMQLDLGFLKPIRTTHSSSQSSSSTPLISQRRSDIGVISLFFAILNKIQIVKFFLSLTFSKIGAKTKIVMEISSMP